MAAHLAHVQWATGQWDAAAQTAQGALADGRGGITTRITAQYVLGYLAMGRGDWSAADNLLREALATGERMAELQRLSPPLWGLAEAARCRGDYDTALTRCERGYQASAEVMDAACLFPYLLTGVRAHLARGDVEAAEEWSARVGAVLTARAIPGTLPAIGHGRGLILLARGDTVRGAPGAGVGAGSVAGPAPVLGGHVGPARPRGGRRQGPAPGRGGPAPGRDPHHRSGGRCHHSRR